MEDIVKQRKGAWDKAGWFHLSVGSKQAEVVQQGTKVDLPGSGSQGSMDVGQRAQNFS